MGIQKFEEGEAPFPKLRLRGGPQSQALKTPVLFLLDNLKYCPFIQDNVILLLVCFLCPAISQNKKSLTLHWSINIYSKPIWIGGQYFLSISSCSCRVVGFTRTTPQKLCWRVISTSLITGFKCSYGDDTYSNCACGCGNPLCYRCKPEHWSTTASLVMTIRCRR